MLSNLCVALLLCLTACASAFASGNAGLLETEKPVKLNVMLPAEMAPYHFYQQQSHEGLLVDYWRLWGERSDISVVFNQHDISQRDVALVWTRLNPRAGDIALPILSLQLHLYYASSDGDMITQQISQQQPVKVGYVVGKGVLPAFLHQGKQDLSHIQLVPVHSTLGLLWQLYQGEIDALLMAHSAYKSGINLVLLDVVLAHHQLLNVNMFAQVDASHGELVDWLSWGNNLIGWEDKADLMDLWVLSEDLLWWLLALVLFTYLVLRAIVVNIMRAMRRKPLSLDDCAFPSFNISYDGKYLLSYNQSFIAHKLAPIGLLPGRQALPDHLLVLTSIMAAGQEDGKISQQMLSMKNVAGHQNSYLLNAKRRGKGKRKHWFCQLCELKTEVDFRPSDSHRQMLLAMLQSHITPACIKDKQGVILAANAAWAGQFGLKVKDVIGKKDADLFSKHEFALIKPIEQSVWLGKAVEQSEFFIVPLTDERGVKYAIMSVKYGEQQMPLSQHQKLSWQFWLDGCEDIFSLYPDPIALVDKSGLCLVVNDAFAEVMVQSSSEQIRGKHIREFLAPDKVEWNINQHQSLIEEGRSVKYEELSFLPDGRKVWFEVAKSPYSLPNNTGVGILMLARDISERKQTEQQLADAVAKLEDLSFVDGLTQVANRRCFDDKLQYFWKSCVREAQPLAVVLMDIDYFKPYNDNYGHQQGDDTLVQVAQAIALSSKRATDLVARYGGEEFVMLLPDTDKRGALMIAETVREKIEGLGIAHAHSQVAKVVTMSLGVVSVVPQVGQDPMKLVQLADKALYQAKESGRNQAQFYRPR
ncbi:transporter substrate-binding domain-containing diguanylate cyclase [Motilimonas pumila]|uniref:diguanylate cyclase n=1 Tax=Motilimonas pumila TaxID=2303987 RepID=A0A418Y9M3_9GAMM|nr:diguanylate cyclase [Motilimonas pumila]RJG37880.1 diguanylate cyclase [Motilimonas pumila]